MSLVDTWLESVHKTGVTTAQGLRDMNQELGTLYRQSRVGEWRAGIRAPHLAARRYMLGVALRHLFPKMRPAARDKLRDQLL